MYARILPTTHQVTEEKINDKAFSVRNAVFSYIKDQMNRKLEA